MLYLVNCEVVKSYYMDDIKKSEVSHIVEAKSEQEAMDKVKTFIQKKIVSIMLLIGWTLIIVMKSSLNDT